LEQETGNVEQQSNKEEGVGSSRRDDRQKFCLPITDGWASRPYQNKSAAICVICGFLLCVFRLRQGYGGQAVVKKYLRKFAQFADKTFVLSWFISICVNLCSSVAKTKGGRKIPAAV
jgi:hypothetical protein